MNTTDPRIDSQESATPAGSFFIDLQSLIQFLDLVLLPWDVTELRILGYGGNPRDTTAGWFDSQHRGQLAKAAITESRRASGCYFAINTVKPALLDRAENKLREADRKKFQLTRDGDILSRNLVLIDVDPIRPADCSATDAEKAAARGVANSVENWLGDQGWVHPCTVDSGNGYHLYYPLEPDVLPVGSEYESTPGILDPLAELLQHLAKKFNTESAQVDARVYTPARISKLPYTQVRKGQATADRPHRKSCVVGWATRGDWQARVNTDLFRATLEKLRAEGGALATPPSVFPVDSSVNSGVNSGANSATNSSGIAANRCPTPELINRVVAYLARMPESVSGNNGHGRLLAAARAAVYEFDLGVDLGYSLLTQYYNPRCVPPWDESDVRRKCEEADTKPFGKPRGHLLAPPLPLTLAHPSPFGPPHPPVGALATPPSAGDAPPPGGAEPPARDPADRRYEPGVPVVANYRTEFSGDKPQLVGLAVSQVATHLLDATQGWPKRVGKILFAPPAGSPDLTAPTAEASDPQPHLIESQPDLFAWMSATLSHRFNRSDNPIDWRSGRGTLIEKTVFHAHLMATAEGYSSIESYPHFPKIDGAYYLCPDVQPSPQDNPTGRLYEFMKLLSPASDVDYDLILSLLMTLVWGGRPGARPAFLIESADTAAGGGRGAGKSTMAQVLSRLVGGAISISQNEQSRDLFVRLLTPQSLTKRVVILDNIKSSHFSNCDIEGLITATEISGRQLFTGDASRPNHLTWIFTCNQPSLSKDLAQRCVPIRVSRPTYDPFWIESIDRYITRHRWEIIADLAAKLAQTPPALSEYSRWANWEHHVLSKTPDPEKLIGELRARRTELDEDEPLGQEIEQAILAWLQKQNPMELNWDHRKVFIASTEIAEAVSRYHSYGENISRISGWLKTVAMPRVKYCRYQGLRGFVWKGEKCDANSLMTDIAGNKLYDDQKNQK